jgi:sugar lactone lactonase YvrE
LIWVDIAGGALHRGTPSSGSIAVEVLEIGRRAAMVAPLPIGTDGWVVASERDLLHVRSDGTWEVVVGDITPDGRRPLNDGVCALDGALWVGSQSAPRIPDSTLYRIVPGRPPERVLSGVTVSNGIAFAPDGATMYYVDTLPRRALEALTIDGGRITDRRTLAEFGVGNPDGIALDDEGCVWVALWDAAEVHRVSPDGTIREVVEVPARRPTAVALHADTLYITTARLGLHNPTDEDGLLFAVAVGVSAPPAIPWAWTPEKRAQ